MLKGVIAEDNVYVCKRLKELICSQGVNITFCTGSGRELLQYLGKNEPDLIFLDIGLPDLSGLEVGRTARLQYPDCEIIFITSYDQYFKEAVEVYAADYITKPLNVSRLKATLRRIRKKRETGTIHEFSSGGELILIQENDIFMLEAQGRKVTIYCRESQRVVSHNLKEMQSILGKNFFRTSRSFLVNIQKVTAIRPYSRTCYSLLLGNNCTALLSKSLFEEFRYRAKGVSHDQD